MVKSERWQRDGGGSKYREQDMPKSYSEQGHSTFLESERSPDHKEQKEKLQEDTGDISGGQGMEVLWDIHSLD